MMMFFFAALAALAAPALSVSVTYDQTYDNRQGSLSTVACSNGINGLLTRGYRTFGDLPTFPHIGGASAVTGWNSPNCGTCWELTFTDENNRKRRVNVLAVDYAANGFNIGLTAMNQLTNGHGVEYGVVDVDAKQVAATVCGMPAK
ncbi:hypothetical protein PLEOSDRAFT_1088021 [Pleurotus ostreatus PC15]|uniref:Cerato-platanin n=1 Tax=Pleurotus ostreatus (strain PC15) TaxID=1137138 RepID=A0A067P1L0_PLEO1|nr:hypothetical protein PLEOSDRAFT_1088021 [Pleurotus ostreatus PC15]